MKLLNNSKGVKSLGKIAEMIFILLALVDLTMMIFFNKSHWATIASDNAVSESVIIALHTSFYGLVVSSIGIRRWGKINNAD